MKKLNELKEARNLLSEELKTIQEDKEGNVDEQRARIDEIAHEFEALNEDIKRMELIERANILEVEKEQPEKVEEAQRTVGEEFRDFLNDAVDGKGPLTYQVRAEPVITSTDSAALNKSVLNAVDILKSPGMAFLNTIGVTQFNNLTGNLVIPRASEVTAVWPAEAGDSSTADMSTTSLTLAARRVSHSQGLTKEMLAQTNPAIFASYVQRLLDGIGNAVADDVFDTLQTDAASRVYTATATGLSYADLVQMEASIGGLSIGSADYVTTPSVKGYLKRTIALGSTVGPAIWTGNEVNGYPAYGVPHANTNKVYFGDFSRMAVGQWGGIEIVVDPYTRAKQGEIVLTAIGLFDTGCTNPDAVVFTTDVSAG